MKVIMATGLLYTIITESNSRSPPQWVSSLNRESLKLANKNACESLKMNTKSLKKAASKIILSIDTPAFVLGTTP